MRQEELKRPTPKKKITHLNLYKKPAINSGLNLTVVTEELTNQPTPTPAINFKTPMNLRSKEINNQAAISEEKMDIDQEENTSKSDL